MIKIHSVALGVAGLAFLLLSGCSWNAGSPSFDSLMDDVVRARFSLDRDALTLHYLPFEGLAGCAFDSDDVGKVREEWVDVRSRFMTNLEGLSVEGQPVMRRRLEISDAVRADIALIDDGTFWTSRKFFPGMQCKVAGILKDIEVPVEMADNSLQVVRVDTVLKVGDRWYLAGDHPPIIVPWEAPSR